jgi:AcrR family transcriptional regulator
MTTARTKQQVVTEFRCAEILEAARKVFSKRSFHDVTVDEIAAAAGIAKATIYQYFPSKQEIYVAALRQGVTDLIDRTNRQVEAAQETRAKLEAFVRVRLDYMEENREFFALYHSEFGNLTHPAGLNREMRNLYRKQLSFLEGVLRRAAERGETKPVQVETLATALYEATRGLMLRRMLGWSEMTVEQDVAALVEILWSGAGKE